MAVRFLQEIVVDCLDPPRLVEFWAALFGAEATVRSKEWAYVESPATRVRIAFQGVPESKSVKNRVHLDIEVADIAVETARLVALGATRQGASWSTSRARSRSCSTRKATSSASSGDGLPDLSRRSAA